MRLIELFVVEDEALDSRDLFDPLHWTVVGTGVLEGLVGGGW